MKAQSEAADDRLLIEAAQRDPRRFADLYEHNFDRMYAYVITRVRDRAEAEDVTAEVFHHALANLNKYEWRGVPFASWLFRIAANAISDLRRRNTREQPADEPGELDSIPADSREFEEVEHRATLFRLVRTLPEEQRQVLLLRFVEQKNLKEVAREMGKTEGAVKQLQFRALTTLRARLEGADA